MDAKQIIAIDFASEGTEDMSAITSMCTKCKAILESRVYDPNKNNMQLSMFVKCPICGVKFNKHIIHEGLI